MATKNELTLEEFLNLPQENGIYELVDGDAVFKVSPKEFHSTLTFALTTLLSRWAKGRGRVRLEWAIAKRCPQSGIALQRNGKTWAPTPDVTYVSYERLPRSVFRNHACPVAPELVIEIISPDQTFKQLEVKAKDYFMAGVLRVWIVDPESMSISILFPDGTNLLFRGDTKIVDPMLPDLELNAQMIFQEAELI